MAHAPDLFSLQGKVALVTGGAKGIGRFYSEALAQAEASVVIADIDGDAVKEATADLEKEYRGRILGAKLDVTSRDSVRGVMKSVESRWGRLDILVNNAAYFATLPFRDNFWEIPDDEWDLVMAVNVRGIFICITEALPLLRRDGWGRIINIASSLAFKGSPILTHYATSKTAVVGLTRSIAPSLGPLGITVNAIAPGGTASATLAAARPSMLSLENNTTIVGRAIKRIEVPEDLVGTLLYLASSASGFVTGQTIVVDGGNYLH